MAHTKITRIILSLTDEQSLVCRREYWRGVRAGLVSAIEAVPISEASFGGALTAKLKDVDAVLADHERRIKRHKRRGA